MSIHKSHYEKLAAIVNDIADAAQQVDFITSGLRYTLNETGLKHLDRLQNYLWSISEMLKLENADFVNAKIC